ncbi:ComEC/Rec2 family competence protein [Kitasatospora acidiphila]|uniref:ComEC/Rec2 family competence protein n=2 Tax=Kitasatospora acidiphila TaxID=2567942 RepID=A0A540WFF0_9ACTN|nr:ComEC/Rec2 family competence protein [Kitasatospora acidiphila]
MGTGTGTGATTTRTSTPITLIVQERDAASWQGLLPSARVAALARVLPASDEGGGDTAAALVAKGPPRLLAPPNWTQRLAGRLRAGLRRACAELAPDARTLLPGLVVGDTEAMPDDLAQAFQSTDLVHITAVSGANLSIVLALLLGAPTRSGTTERGGLASFLGIPLRVAALVGVGLTVAFVILCRPEPSVLRAAATGLLSLLALALGRPRQALSALAAGVLTLLLVDPFLARSYGFLLSVLATAGLLTLGRRWAKALHQRGWPHGVAEAVACTASAQALCAPAAVLLAPRISLVGIPCNLLAELAVMPATLLGFAALAVAPLSGGVAAFLAGMAGYPTQWLAAVARAGAALPGAELAWTPGWRGTVTLALGVLAACYAGRLFFPADPATADPDTGKASTIAPSTAAPIAPASTPPR